MTESYLHFIWGMGRLIATNLETTKGAGIQIIKYGWHNQMAAGPDFSHATINIDGIEWHGPVEIHVKSSDWYKHRHQNDPAYNNVILHVVFEHDREVYQDGRILPTLELKPFVDWGHFEKYERFKSNRHEIACANLYADTDPIFMKSMLSKALIQKWNQKEAALSEYISDADDAMYYYWGAAFGGHLNMHPFLQTIAKIPRKDLMKVNSRQRFNWLVGESGLLDEGSADVERWHFKGNRPGSFPTKRLFQFANFMDDEQLKLLVNLSEPEEVLTHFDAIVSPVSPQLKLTRQFKNQLIINGLVPYFNYCANRFHEQRYQDLAHRLLELLPAEKNFISRKWTAIGKEPLNAWESQGLLALFRYYCSAKKCLSCEVGNAIING
jgi:hypothetical protein